MRRNAESILNTDIVIFLHKKSNVAKEVLFYDCLKEAISSSTLDTLLTCYVIIV